MSQQYPHQQQPYPQQPPAPRKRHIVRNVLLVTTGAFVLLVGGCTAIVASMSGDGTKQSAGASSSTPPAGKGPASGPAVAPTKKPTPPVATKTTVPPKLAAMTAGQEQAIGKAEDYLSFTAFSRKGLIRQLSSDAGEGFSVADATFAADHVKVDWKEQAAKKAKEYLQMTHFSRKGLIHQLESSAGEGFTHAQAVYGVTKAGL